MDSTEDYTSAWMLERRVAPRHRVQRAARLLFAASLARVKSPDDTEQDSPAVIGHTRDISMTGLGLIVPVIRDSDVGFYGVQSPLRVTLSLPNSIVNLRGVPIRYEWLEESDTFKRFLMGVVITEMSEEDHVRYAEYLDTLEGGDPTAGS
jgi:hypothetical protein